MDAGSRTFDLTSRPSRESPWAEARCQRTRDRLPPSRLDRLDGVGEVLTPVRLTVPGVSVPRCRMSWPWSTACLLKNKVEQARETAFQRVAAQDVQAAGAHVVLVNDADFTQDSEVPGAGRLDHREVEV